MSAILQTVSRDAADGALNITVGTYVPNNYSNGLPFEANGNLSVDDSSPIVVYHMGIPFTSNGRVAVSAGDVDHYGGGATPYDAFGAIAVGNTALSTTANGVPYT